jgi:hypothetical protein
MKDYQVMGNRKPVQSPEKNQKAERQKAGNTENPMVRATEVPKIRSTGKPEVEKKVRGREVGKNRDPEDQKSGPAPPFCQG